MIPPKKRLKKLYALALRGVGGEKTQAQAILDRLLKKYSISIEELDDESEREYRLEYHGKEQEKLLKQTIYKVTNNRNAFFNLQYTASGRKCKTLIGVTCSAAQKMEIEFLFDFYKRLWEKEREALLLAFIVKHDIYGNLKEGEKPTDVTPEEALKLHALMRGLSDEKPLKQLTAPKEA